MYVPLIAKQPSILCPGQPNGLCMYPDPNDHDDDDDGDDDDDDGDDDNLRQEVNAKTRTALKVLRCLIGSACFVFSPASPIYIQKPKASLCVKKLPFWREPLKEKF